MVYKIIGSQFGIDINTNICIDIKLNYLKSDWGQK